MQEENTREEAESEQRKHDAESGGEKKVGV
jgi:hypothetical protein